MNATHEGRPPTPVKRTVSRGRLPNAHYRQREYLMEREVERLMKAAGSNRHGHRDATMVLLAYRARCGGSSWTSCMASCMSPASRTACQACIRSPAKSYGPYAGCSASRSRGACPCPQPVATTIAHKQLTKSQRGASRAARICFGVRENWNGPDRSSRPGPLVRLYAVRTLLVR